MSRWNFFVLAAALAAATASAAAAAAASSSSPSAAAAAAAAAVVVVGASASAPLRVPLSGNFSALFMYYAYVHVGPHAFTVTVDTGSSDLLVPQAGCADCYGGNPADYYNGTASPTGAAVSCAQGKQRGLHCARCGPPTSSSSDIGDDGNNNNNNVDDDVDDAGQCGYTESYVGIALDAWVFDDVTKVRGFSTSSSAAGSLKDGGAAEASAPLSFGAIYNVSFGFSAFAPAAAAAEAEAEAAAAAAAAAEAAPALLALARARWQEKQRRMGGAVAAVSGGPPGGYPEGMLGMGYPKINTLGTTMWFDALRKAQGWHDVFALCLRPVGGAMELGGSGAWVSRPQDTIWASVVREDFYTVDWQDTLVDGTSVGVPPHVYNQVAAIVDSGTPVATLPQVAFDALHKLVLGNCSRSHLHGVCDVPAGKKGLFDGVCMKLTDAQRDAFPTISFALRGDRGSTHTVAVTYTPDHYLIPLFYCQEPGTVGLALGADPKFAVLGASVMQAYTTIFDRQNQRVGFNPALCTP